MEESRLHAVGKNFLSVAGGLAKGGGQIGLGAFAALLVPPVAFLLAAVSAAVLAIAATTALVGGGLLLVDMGIEKYKASRSGKSLSADESEPLLQEPATSLKQEQAQAPKQEHKHESRRELNQEPIHSEPEHTVTRTTAQESSKSVGCLTTPQRRNDSQLICEQYESLATKKDFDSHFYKSQQAKTQSNGSIKMTFKNTEDMEKFLSSLASTGVKFIARDNSGKELFKTENNKLVASGATSNEQLKAEVSSSREVDASASQALSSLPNSSSESVHEEISPRMT